MAGYVYKMVQIPPEIEITKKEKGNEAASYLEQVVNQMADQGWEFYRVDQVGVTVYGGCLSAGKPKSQATYYVVTFRKPR
jgi:hypothetical protein